MITHTTVNGYDRESFEDAHILPSREAPPTPVPLSTCQDGLKDENVNLTAVSEESDSTSSAPQVKEMIPRDLEQIWEWNHTLPTSIDRCVHEIIKERTEDQPSAPAICAWDGELTYGELDRIATALAGRLVDFGVRPDTIVPLCFEKSMWTTVGMLGVLKAGAAFVLLDSSLPEDRLQAMYRQTKATIAVTSQSKEALTSRLTPRVVTLGSHISKVSHARSDSQLCYPSPSSAMYVAFTSGSTGIPKGATITHRNLASALHHQRKSLKHTVKSRVFDFSSYSFDVSICNAFATLATGGCICVPNENDRQNRLAESIASLNANAIDLTPSVARLLSPEQVPGLQTIIFGGEALYVRDVNPWWGRVQIVSLYGPCECTPNSTINYNPTSPKEATHMGTGVGSVTWIVDPENHESLLPLGFVGELLLEGPLVGQGYLNDPEKTAAAFIEDPIWLLHGAPGRPGRHGRLYKTGDLVRYNEDGNLIFIGRKDTQVKIRGQRVELGEIEHVLRSHDCVDDAVAVLQHVDGQETSIASFVTVRSDDATPTEWRGNGEEVRHVEEWKEQFDADYLSIQNIQPETLGRDFMGWTSMYDGSDIDKGQMNEWLDDTIETMLNGSQPGNVLEIGTGSGMILFNLTEGMESYVGLEPSGRAVEFITEAAKSVPVLANKVKMFEATTADLGRLGSTMSPNLVVLNSVIQYFPSQVYLLGVVQELLGLEGIKTLFFGDVRSYALHRQILAARALHIAGGKANKNEIRRIMAEMERAESELLVDPAFFITLRDRLSDQIAHVEILPQKIHATNELSSYRYAAVIHVKARGHPQQQIHKVDQDKWIDFIKHGLNRQLLSKHLQHNSTSSAITVSNIPHSKSIFERHVVRALDEQGDAIDHSNWLSSARQEAQDCPSLSAVDLAELASQAGYRVEISWSRQFSQSGGLDAIFHRQQPINGERRVMFDFPDDHRGRPYHSLSSEPLHQRLRQKIKDQLYEMLRTRLPSYMVPQTVTLLDKMPLNDNGKIDRRVLGKRLPTRTAGRGPVRQPVSEVERQIRKIWGQVLNIEPALIGLDDSFFDLGGDSIQAMKVVSEARKAGIELKVLDVFFQPELHKVVRQARTLA